MKHDPVIDSLFARIHELLAEANALADKRLPLWRRALNANRAKAKVDEAQDLLDEITLRIGEKVDDDGKPQRFGPFTRRHLIVLQWGVGILNAHSLVNQVANGQWVFAVFSLLSMFACTLWVLPRKPRKTRL